MRKLLILLAVTLFLVVSCGTTQEKGNNSNDSSDEARLAEAAKKKDERTLMSRGEKVNFDKEKYEIKQYDINKDEKPDIINIFKKAPGERKGDVELTLYAKFMDLNHDGNIDVWRYFDEKTGSVSTEELDLDFDGKVDRVDSFIDGIVRKSEYDFQFDSKCDITKFYDEKGILLNLESDLNGDGVADYWEYYNNGVIERVEKDTNGDGKADAFKRSNDAEFTEIVAIDKKFEGGVPADFKETPEDEMKPEAEAKPEAQPEVQPEVQPEAEPAAPAQEEPKPESEETAPEAPAAE
ncbi:hypothetical protein J5834_05750 [bacterium]|nr:hypothetical protein [bacterium]